MSIIIGIICDFIMSLMFYGTLYALLGYVYAQGKQAARQPAAAPETETGRAQWSGESVCVAAVDVQADGYTVYIRIWPREPESREAECCGGAHPPAPRSSFRAFSSNVNKRSKRAGPSWTCED